MSASEEKITVVIADDHPLIRDGIRKALEQTNDILVVGEACDVSEMQKLISELHPRILILDLFLPGLHLAETGKWLRENHPETITLLLMNHNRNGYLSLMIDAGMAGYLIKNEAGERLIGAIRLTVKGNCLFDEQDLTRAKRWKNCVGNKLESLTNREREILRLIAEGKKNKEIAHAFCVALKTVEKHLANIYEKLDVNSKTEAALWWLENGRDFTN